MDVRRGMLESLGKKSGALTSAIGSMSKHSSSENPVLVPCTHVLALLSRASPQAALAGGVLPGILWVLQRNEGDSHKMENVPDDVFVVFLSALASASASAEAAAAAVRSPGRSMQTSPTPGSMSKVQLLEAKRRRLTELKRDAQSGAFALVHGWDGRTLTVSGAFTSAEATGGSHEPSTMAQKHDGGGGGGGGDAVDIGDFSFTPAQEADLDMDAFAMDGSSAESPEQRRQRALDAVTNAFGSRVVDAKVAGGGSKKKKKGAASPLKIVVRFADNEACVEALAAVRAHGGAMHFKEASQGGQEGGVAYEFALGPNDEYGVRVKRFMRPLSFVGRRPPRDLLARYLHRFQAATVALEEEGLAGGATKARVEAASAAGLAWTSLVTALGVTRQTAAEKKAEAREKKKKAEMEREMRRYSFVEG